MADSWYYTVGGQQQGPVSADDLRGLMVSGHVSAQDLAWKDGMAQWTAVSLLPELSVAAGAELGPTNYYADPAQGQTGTMPLNYGGYQQYSTPAQGYPARLQYGGFWIRVGVYSGLLVLLVPNIIINQIVAFAVGQTRTQGPPDPAQIVSMVMLSFIPAATINWLYFALMESSAKQATLGKMACSLMVIDEGGRRLTFGRATGRYFAKMLSFIVCYVGVIMVGVDERKRGWHDQLAKTFVVTKSSLMGSSRMY